MDANAIAEKVFTKKASLIHRPALAHLCSMAQNAPEGMAVEIGVYRGTSLAAIAIAREGKGEVIGVDDWSHPEPPNLQQLALDTLKWHGVDVLLLSMTSEEAAYRIAPPMAFVHIDANHTLEYVREDIAMWAPKIMPGGVIAFHDTTGWEGPRRLVRSALFRNPKVCGARFWPARRPAHRPALPPRSPPQPRARPG